MKHLAVVAVAVLALYGCSKDPVEVGGSNNQAIPVDTLFTYNGCTEYRFEDGGHNHYYTVCDKGSSVTTTSQYSESCGKNCVKTIVDENPTQ